MAEATTEAGTQTGVSRDSTGAIATPGSEATTTQTTETPASTTSEPDGGTLLTQTKQPEAKTETKTEAKGAPEKYEDFKVPDGFELDPKVKAEIEPLFKGLGLSQEGAQSLVDFYTKQTREAAEAPAKAWTDMANEWRTASENHPDLRGKLGPGGEVNVRIGKLLDSLGDPALTADLRKFMDITMAGNHPAFIRAFNIFAQRLTEGTHVSGNDPSKEGQSLRPTGQPNAAAAMYPNLPSRNGRAN